MEEIKISKEKLAEIKDRIIFILLFFWMIMPIIQTIKPFYDIINIKEIYFALMKITGIAGIGISIVTIYKKIRESEDKKDTIKGLLPIFIFVLYMIWTLISCFLSPNVNQAFNGNYYRKEGYFMYINYAGYFLCALLLENKKLKKILLNAFIVTSVFLIILSRICLDGERFTNIFVNNKIETTVFAQFNHYGYYLMMSLICCLGLFMKEKNKILKVIYLIIYTLIGYATIYNDTFGCYLATLIILILYGIYAIIKKTDKKAISVAIIIFVILSCITTVENENIAYKNITRFGKDIRAIICKIVNIDVEDEEIEKEFEEAGTSRMQLWVNGVKFVLKRPIIGYGPDNLRVEYLNEGIKQDRPHNLLIYLAAVSGIPGMIIYMTAVGIIVVKGVKKLLTNNKNGMIYLIIVITYLISAMFGNSMFYTSPYFFIFLGCLMNCNLRKNE